jgi:DNA helicase-2/ATP-dependent DNA helicase PcrA
MRQLYLTHAEVRRLHGSEHYTSPSRFLGEVPPELIDEVRPQPQLRRPWRMAGSVPVGSPDAVGMKLGQRVRHQKFGEGVVMNYEGQGAHARVQVNFQAAGSKWLVLAYANLQQI